MDGLNGKPAPEAWSVRRWLDESESFHGGHVAVRVAVDASNFCPFGVDVAISSYDGKQITFCADMDSGAFPELDTLIDTLTELRERLNVARAWYEANREEPSDDE